MTLKGEHISSHQIIVPGVGLQLYNPGFMPFKNHWLALLNVDSPEYTNHVFSRLLLIDSSANILWKRDYGKGDTCILENLISTKDGGFAMLGYRNDSNSLQDFYLVRTYDSTLYTSLEQKNKNHESLKIYPNPTSGSFTIHIPESLNNFETAIFNSSGQNVYSKHFSSASEFSLNLEDNPKGIYFVRITSENKLYSSIIVKE